MTRRLQARRPISKVCSRPLVANLFLESRWNASCSHLEVRRLRCDRSLNNRAPCDSMAELRIGTSGWNYREWRGSFFPTDLPTRKWLAFYAAHFNSVEINYSFYRLPSEESCDGWYRQTPENSRFAVKASRFLTHNQTARRHSRRVGHFSLLTAKFSLFCKSGHSSTGDSGLRCC